MPNRPQLKRNLGGDGAAADAKSGMPEMPKQKREEGRGWAEPINVAAKPNTYTGPGGSKRD